MIDYWTMLAALLTAKVFEIVWKRYIEHHAEKSFDHAENNVNKFKEVIR